MIKKLALMLILAVPVFAQSAPSPATSNGAATPVLSAEEKVEILKAQRAYLAALSSLYNSDLYQQYVLAQRTFLAESNKYCENGKSRLDVDSLTCIPAVTSMVVPAAAH